jgi:hypothetical protein
MDSTIPVHFQRSVAFTWWRGVEWVQICAPGKVNQCEYMRAPLIAVQLQGSVQLHCVVKVLSIFTHPWFSFTVPTLQH